MADAPEGRTRLARLALLALALLLFVALRVPYVSIPFERDEGEYAYIAQRMLQGDVPYRDAFDQKPPGVFAVYAACFALFGESVEAVHGLLYAWTAATAVLLHLLVATLAGGLAAAAAVLVFAIASTDPRLAATAANTEQFMLLPLVASTWCLVRGLASRRLGWWIACGALAAAACWFKPVAVTNAVFVVLYGTGASLRAGAAAGTARVVGGLALGALLAAAPVFAAFAAAGALGPFVDAVFLHNLSYSQRLPLSAVPRNLAWPLAQQAPSFAVFWLGALAALAWPRLAGRRAWGLLACFALASAAGVSIGFYFRLHYFLQLLPALAALCGVALAAALRRVLALPSPAPAAALAVLLGAAIVVPPIAANRDRSWGATPEQISRRIYGLNPFVESPRVAAYIRRTSEPEDTVYVVGSEPQILFYARRRSATRYIIFYPLTSGFPDALERQRELIEEVRAARPLYVVWANIPTSSLVTPNSEQYVFDATRELLDTRYALEFVARPPAQGDLEFEFVYGTRARALLAEALGAGRSTPWIAVFRRAG